MSAPITSSITYTIDLSAVQRQLTRSLAFLLALGLMGNLASCMVFRQRQFRSNGISLLFTVASLFNIAVLVYGIGSSLYALDHVRLETYSIIFCKVRLYIRHILLMTVRSYVVLACAAAFALSSPRTNLRFLCQPRFVRRITLAVPFVWSLVAVHMPVFSTIRNGECVDIDSYILPFAIYAFVVVGVFPLFAMTSFILLTIRNLRVLRSRIQPSIASPSKLKSRDHQFIRMLVSLVLMYVVTNLFYPANILYLAVTYWSEKGPERSAIESIVYSLTRDYVVYINNLSPFFLFICSSSAFRRSFCDLMHTYVQGVMRRDVRRRQASVTTVPGRTS